MSAGLRPLRHSTCATMSKLSWLFLWSRKASAIHRPCDLVSAVLDVHSPGRLIGVTVS